MLAQLVLSRKRCLFGMLCVGWAFGLVAGGGPAAVVAAEGPAPRPVTLLFEAEQFQFPGGWVPLGDRDALNKRFLMIGPGAFPPPDAMTVIDIPVAGAYTVWARSRNHTLNQSGQRRYRVTFDGEPVAGEAAQHTTDDFRWQRLGEVALDAGQHMLGLRAISSRYARCDSILLTNGGFDPSPASAAQLARFRRAPLAAPSPLPPAMGEPVGAAVASPAPAAELSGERLKLSFFVAGGGDQPTVVYRRLSVREPSGWTYVPDAAAPERVYLQHAAKIDVQFIESHPLWSGAAVSYKIDVRGKTYAVQEAENPYFAAPLTALSAQAVRQIDAETVELTYVAAGVKPAVGRWTLEPGRFDAQFSLDLEVPQDGFFSALFAPLRPRPLAKIDAVQLPPLYQFQRVPPRPQLLMSSVTPHPAAIVQFASPETSKPLSLAVVADPEKLPFRWATAFNGPYGFSLRCPTGDVQAAAFSPILGLPDSAWKAGEKRSLAWRLLAVPGPWPLALETLSREVMQVRDYRRPIKASLTDAALNMIDLMHDAQASGWSAELKGFWNIEMESTVTHAAPLGLVSAAVLARDEQLFRERGLPSIESVLTRPNAHFAWVGPDGKPPRLTVPMPFYGAALWQGLDAVLGNVNPWLREFGLVDGQPRHSRAYNSSPVWSDLLAAYRWNPSPELLAEIRTQADTFIAQQITARQERPVDWQAFYNISYYPYWWDLLDLFELTGDVRYRDAAQQCAYFTVAGLWSHPQVPAGDITINPGGESPSEVHLWWKGAEKFRLGYPRGPDATPERRLSAWQVAQVGIGVEQPSTYFTTKIGQRNIMMATWAPHLLRAFQHTGRSIFETYARNSVVGRYSNYPGYYLVGYTDLVHRPRYPFDGPDVTSIYYHHIPVHLTFTIDFLVAQAASRSAGKIRFPYAKQQGYAWFSSRVYGGAPGELFGQPGADLWLDRKLVTLDTIDVDWLAARSVDRFWLVLMSQADQPLDVKPQLDRARIGLRDGDVLVYAGQGGEPQKLSAGSSLSITVPPKGLVAVSLPAEKRARFGAVTPLPRGHVVEQLGEPWGDLHGFRLRTPFGHDALYVVLTGAPADAEATLTLAGHEALAPRKQFPYEFSIYPWPMDKPAQATIELRRAGQAEPLRKTLTLDGTP